MSGKWVRAIDLSPGDVVTVRGIALDIQKIVSTMFTSRLVFGPDEDEDLRLNHDDLVWRVGHFEPAYNFA